MFTKLQVVVCGYGYKRAVGSIGTSRRPHDDWKIAQARAAILDYRAAHNISSTLMSSNRYDMLPTALTKDEPWRTPFYTLDRIAFWRRTEEGG